MSHDADLRPRRALLLVGPGVGLLALFFRNADLAAGRGADARARSICWLWLAGVDAV